MKIQAYDKYHKQTIVFELEDEIPSNTWCSSSWIGLTLELVCYNTEWDRDNCDPKRWSDMEDIKIIE